MQTFNNITNGETGTSVRGKLNNALTSIISGSEGINAIWAKISSVVQRIDGMETGISKIIKDTSYNPDSLGTDKSVVLIALCTGTFNNIKDKNGIPITIPGSNAITIFYRAVNTTYWEYDTQGIFPAVDSYEGNSPSKIESAKTHVLTHRGTAIKPMTDFASVFDTDGNSLADLSLSLNATEEKADTALRMMPFDGVFGNPTIETQGVSSYDAIIFDDIRCMFLARKNNKFYMSFIGIEDYNTITSGAMKARTDRLYRLTGTQFVYYYDGTALAPFIFSKSDRDELEKVAQVQELATQAKTDAARAQETADATKSELDNKMGDLLNGIHTNLLEGAEWEVGRIFQNAEINTTDYPSYRVYKFDCERGDKITVAASYTPTPAFIGYIREDNKVEVVINGTGGAIEETTIDCVNATYVICEPVNGIKYITKLEKLAKSIIQSIEDKVSVVENNLEQKIDDAPVNGKQYVRKDAGWEEVEVESKEPIITDLINSVEWKDGRVVSQWIDTSAKYSKLCEIEIANDGDELIVASNKSGPANVSFLSKKTDATHAENIISSTDGEAIPEQRIVCEKGVYIVCIYAYPTTDVTVLTKIEYPVDEQKEENKRNRGFLYGKTIASLGDSLSTSGLWQNELVKKGAIFNAEKNYTDGQPSYSSGGTVTCDAKDVNCGHIRARRLVEDNIVIPDVIFIENVNDSRLAPPPNHETPSDIDDEPFFLTDVINYATTYNSKQDAITAWENNFASIVGTVTAKKGVAFLLKYKVSAKVFTINSVPTQNGYIEITAAGNDVKRITLTTSDTIATVIEKILAYDYSGWTDNKKSSNAVIFSPSITGDVDITANTCGLTFTKTTEESTNSIARCFCSVDVSKWNDKTVWNENPGLFASYKGIVEYLQNAFPTAQIVFFIPETWGLNYNASTYKRADGTIDVDKIAKSYSYVGYLFTLQKQFCERYNLRVIDVRGKCGANYINISQFNAPDEVHPKKLGYQRWGEQIVRELN